MKTFLAGVNKPWFGGAYAGDLGRNELSGSQLWHWPHSEKVPTNFAKPDRNPPQALIEKQDILGSYFSQARQIELCRVWVFERMEGIVFNDDFQITGIYQHMIDHVKQLLDMAHTMNVKLYLCLNDGWGMKNEPPAKLREIGRIDDYNRWNAIVRKAYTNMIKRPDGFLYHVLDELLINIRGHPALWGIDVMNEPEGLYMPSFVNPIPPVSIFDVNQFLLKCVDVVKKRGVRASIGWMRRSSAMHMAAYTDFADFHHYSITASVPTYYKEDFAGRDCLIGECGYSVTNNNNELRKQFGVRTAAGMINDARNKGYLGALAWPIEGEGLEQQDEVLLASVRQMSGQETVKAPVRPWWMSLLGWLPWLTR